MSLMEVLCFVFFFTLKGEKVTRTHFPQFSSNAQRPRREWQRPELSKFSSKEDWYPSFGKHSAVDRNLSPWSGKAGGWQVTSRWDLPMGVHGVYSIPSTILQDTSAKEAGRWASGGGTTHRMSCQGRCCAHWPLVLCISSLVGPWRAAWPGTGSLAL